MTNQVSDLFLFEGELYEVCRSSHLRLSEWPAIDRLSLKALQPFFNVLQDHSHWGTSCTACYKGYRFNYAFENNRLYLQKIETMLKPEMCPMINGVAPLVVDSGLIPTPKGFTLNLFPAHYENLQLLIRETCHIVIGINRTPRHRDSPYAEPSDFADVYCLEFTNGVLRKKTHVPSVPRPSLVPRLSDIIPSLSS